LKPAACPTTKALQVILREVDDVIAVTDEEVAQAMAALFADTHKKRRRPLAARCSRRPLAGRVVGVALTAAMSTATCSRCVAG